jgi:hypothetical protein
VARVLGLQAIILPNTVGAARKDGGQIAPPSNVWSRLMRDIKGSKQRRQNPFLSRARRQRRVVCDITSERRGRYY